MCDRYYLLWQLVSFSMEEFSVAVYLNRVTSRLGHPLTVYSDIS